MSAPATTIERDVIATLQRTGWRYWLLLLGSVALAAVGGYCWSRMLRQGLGVLGINNVVAWGCLITTFVFFIGVSHSGTLVSAILYFTGSPLRSAIGRSAEAMTVIAIMTAGLFPIMHLGRAWLFYWLLPVPTQGEVWMNFRSPLAWDVFAISSYVISSALFLYMGTMPDLYALSHKVGGWRRPLYRILSLGFSGSDREWGVFERAYPIFAGIVIPLAVSVHSIVSWDFAMALTPGWHSTIFAPYFVAGAIFSGLAMAIILLAFMRRGFRLKAHIRPEHFDMLAKLLLGMSLAMTLVYATEIFLAYYRGDPVERDLYVWRMVGPFAPLFWLVVFCNSVAPLAFFSRKVRRSLPALVVIAFLVSVGMWFERFLIVVTGLAHNFDPHQWSGYVPSPIEIGIVAGSFGWFSMLFLLFIKVFPCVSISETKEMAYLEQRADAGEPADG